MNIKTPPNPDITAASDSSPLDVELHLLHCALMRHEDLLAGVDARLAPVKNVARLSAEGQGKIAAPDVALSPLGDAVREFALRVERATQRLTELNMALEV